MKITCDLTNSKKIEVINVDGDLREGGALDLRDYLYTRLDEKKCYQLIDLQGAKNIDALGIKVLSDLTYRGIRIGLFHVEAEIRMMLRMSGKEEIVNIYNEIDRNKVISTFEEDLLMTKERDKESIENRRYQRVKVDFETAFNYCREDNVVITGTAEVSNISEGGMLVKHVITKKKNNGIVLNMPDISRPEFLNLKFKLITDSDNIIEAKGKCIREFISGENLIAAIYFNDIYQDDKEVIRNFVNREYLSHLMAP